MSQCFSLSACALLRAQRCVILSAVLLVRGRWACITAVPGDVELQQLHAARLTAACDAVSLREWFQR
jgi:hypothetical protein